MKIYDISPIIDDSSPIFPGDQPFERQEILSFEAGDNLTLSWIKSTVHVGAHADAPKHYHPDGETIEQRNLEYYLGTCQVVDASHVGPRRMMKADVNLSNIKASRVLFKTKSFRHRQAFQNDFTSLSPELIDALAAKNICLLGLDTPSVDPAAAKDLESHQAIYSHNLAVLEGLDLDQVPEGIYQLVALPLRIGCGDASPVRAILIDGQLI